MTLPGVARELARSFKPTHFFALAAIVIFPLASRATPIHFIDATTDVGLPLINSARLCLVDLNNDGRADVVARVQDKVGAAFHVYLNHAEPKSRFGFRFDEINADSLPIPSTGDLLAFADLDNDGIADAIFTRYLDLRNPKFVGASTQPTTQPLRHPAANCWLKGRGDGTFGEPQIFTAATRGTTACLAVGDADGDGLPDVNSATGTMSMERRLPPIALICFANNRGLTARSNLSDARFRWTIILSMKNTMRGIVQLMA